MNLILVNRSRGSFQWQNTLPSTKVNKSCDEGQTFATSTYQTLWPPNCFWDRLGQQFMQKPSLKQSLMKAEPYHRNIVFQVPMFHSNGCLRKGKTSKHPQFSDNWRIAGLAQWTWWAVLPGQPVLPESCRGAWRKPLQSSNEPQITLDPFLALWLWKKNHLYLGWMWFGLWIRGGLGSTRPLPRKTHRFHVFSSSNVPVFLFGAECGARRCASHCQQGQHCVNTSLLKSFLTFMWCTWGGF